MIGQTISHYRILEALGAGGMGVVYKAEDTRLKRAVALKFLPEALSDDPLALTRFEREAQMASALNHPHICTVYDIGQHEGRRFIAMELLEGQTLGQRMSERRLSVDEIVTVSLEILDGLEAANALGIIHRDLKPANIFLTQRGRVKILDFGLAKLGPVEPTASTRTGGDALTSAGDVVGTVAYMSPEQALGQSVDARTDLFSLGVMLYEMATGELPFRGSTSAARFESLLHQAPPSLARHSPHLPERMVRIVEKALEKDRRVRYQSAREMLEAVEQVRLELDAGPPAEDRAGPARVPSLAVLPFANLSADRENEYFSDGLAEDIIDALTQVPGLRVVARTSAFAFRGQDQDVREIGRRLNVDHILEGSVRRSGNRVRVTVQLVKTSDGFHLWSQRFDREMTDIFVIQDEISQATVEKLRVRLIDDHNLRRRRTVDPEAYQLYLKGLYHWNKTTLEGVLNAIRYLEEAIARDPSYGVAYSWLANCYSFLGVNYRPPHDVFPKGRAAALKALELDSEMSEPHLSMAGIQIFYDWDWEGAGHHLDRALALSPNNAFAHNLKAYHLELTNRPDEAMSEIMRAQELDPLALVINLDVGIRHYRARRYDRAIDQYRALLEVSPHALISYWLWLAYEQQGDYRNALIELQKLTPIAGDPVTESSGQSPLSREDYTAALRQALPKLRAPRDRQILSAGDIAAIYALQGDTDRAFEWLDQAYAERDARLPWITLDPRFDSLRADPRFQVLVRKMNLALNRP